jgi:hypothetical protein
MHQGGAVERAIGRFREHASAGFDDGEIGNHDSFARRQGGLDKPNRRLMPAQDVRWVVGRCGPAALILSEKIYRKAAKVAKERRGKSDWI